MLTVVVGYDGSLHGQHALAWAARLAAAHGGEVHAVQALAMPHLPPGSAADTERRLNEHEAAVRTGLEAACRAQVGPGLALHVHTARWLPPEAILHQVQAQHADLVCVGRSGAGRAMERLLGSVSSEVVRLAEAPVLVAVGAPPAGLPRRVLVGVDGSPHSIRALQLALAWFPGADVTALFAGDVPGGEQTLRDTLAAAGVGPGAVHSLAVHEKAAPAIVHEARAGGYELVMVGRRGLSPLQDLLIGTVSEAVVHRSPCSVIVVK